MASVILEEEVLAQSLSSDQERISNFNANNCITDNTKLIIVGTITPPKGVAGGYFYSAPRNKIYMLIDSAKGTNLCDLKEKLLKATSLPAKEKIVDEVKQTLEENNIAFLDVMKLVIRKKDKSSDNDIISYCLDEDSFKDLNKEIFFICNSRLAEKCYKQICSKLKRPENYEYLTQYWGKINKNKWVEEIIKHT